MMTTMVITIGSEDLALLTRFEQVKADALGSVPKPKFHVARLVGDDYTYVHENDPPWVHEDRDMYRAWGRNQRDALDAALLAAFTLSELEILATRHKTAGAEWFAAHCDDEPRSCGSALRGNPRISA